MQVLKCKCCGKTASEPQEFVLRVTEKGVPQYRDGLYTHSMDENKEIKIQVCYHCDTLHAPEL